MKKSDSKPNIETPEKELKRLRKENAKLKSQKMALLVEFYGINIILVFFNSDHINKVGFGRFESIQ